MKTKKEPNALKEEMNRKQRELTEEGLEQVTGGEDDVLPDETEEDGYAPEAGSGYGSAYGTGTYGPKMNPSAPPFYHHHKHHECYLTTACMKHFSEAFDDNCHELTVLRWFRDNCVKPEDIELYYRVAPRIVEHIDSLPADERDRVYKDIYKDVVGTCVELIENRQYEKAYERYKSATLDLERRFVTC